MDRTFHVLRKIYTVEDYLRGMPRKKKGGGRRKSYYKKKFFFSIRERILLHLSEFGMYENEVEAPDDLTQFGIADTVLAGRSTCSKLLTEMEEEGLLYGRRAHVPSGKIRRTVYFLTPRGQMEGQKIRRKVEVTTVKFKRASGELEKLRVVDVPQEVPVHARLVDVICHISRGVFDVERFVHRMKATRQRVAYVGAMPRLRHFFDRKRELEAIDAWWASPKARILVLTGLPGMGKTTLASKVVSDLRERTNVFWHRFYEWTTVRDVLRQMGEFLGRLNRKDLFMHVDTHESLDMTEVFFLLEKNLRDQEALLVLDDYDKAGGQLDGFFAAFKDLLGRESGPKLLVVARALPKFYDRRDVKVRELVQEMELEGLDREGAATLLTLKNIREGDVEAVYQKTQGHPLFLELLQGPDVAETKDIDVFLRQEVFDRLLDVERRVLGLASVFRKPVPAEALFLDQDVDFVVLTSLADQSLLKETTPRTFDLHDLVRGFFHGQLTPALRARYHQWAARFYASQGEAEDLVDAQHHYLEAGEGPGAAALAIEHGRTIIGKGLLEEFAQVLERLREEDLDPEGQLRVRLLQGEVENVRGQWETAEAAYREAVEGAAVAGLGTTEAEARRCLGDLLLNRGEYEAAEAELNQSLKLYGKLKDREGQAEACYSMGFLRNRQSEFMEAYRSFRKGYRLVREDGDPTIRANLLYAFGVNYAQRSNYRKAVSYKIRALTILEDLRDLRQLAKVYTGLGASHQELDNVEQAEDFYEKGAEVARLIGDQRTLAYALQNLGGIHLQRDQVDEAEEFIRESSTIFATLGEKRKIGWSHLLEGHLLFLRGRVEEAVELWRRGLGLLRELKDLRGASLFSLTIARRYIESGDVAQAEHHLAEARKMAREIRLEVLLQQIEEEKERLEAMRQGQEAPKGRGIPGPTPG